MPGRGSCSGKGTEESVLGVGGKQEAGRMDE